MLGIGKKLRVGAVTMLCAVVAAFPVFAGAETLTPTLISAERPAVIVTEFQTNGGVAAHEFIELYNATDEDINFEDAQWKLQFFNSTAVKAGAPVWTAPLTANNSVNLTGTISAHDYYVISSADYLPGGVTPDMTYVAANSRLMTDTGGGLQLLAYDSSTGLSTAHDRIMWLAQSGTVMPAGVISSPAAGKSQQRIPDDNDEYFGVDNTMSLFGAIAEITPMNPWRAPDIIEPDPVNTPTEPEPETPGSEPAEPTTNPNAGLTPPYLTELLPNPASPLTDADDEFIELYNPNDVALDLDGYRFEVGTSTIRTFNIPAGTVVQPQSYLAFKSAETGLSLSNSGGQVKLRDPAGQLLGQPVLYETADDGEAWVLSEGAWQWSTTPTFGSANVIAIPATAAAKTAAAKPAKATTKAATTKKAAATAKAKTTKAKTTKPKSTKKKAETAKVAAISEPAKPKPPIHIGVLVAVASVAVLYGLYEYRHDIALKFRQLRGHGKAGLPDRLATAGR